MTSLSVLGYISDVPCKDGLVFRECRTKLDDFCHGGFGIFTFPKWCPRVEVFRMLTASFSSALIVQRSSSWSLPWKGQRRLLLSTRPRQVTDSLRNLCERLRLWVNYLLYDLAFILERRNAEVSFLFFPCRLHRTTGGNEAGKHSSALKTFKSEKLSKNILIRSSYMQLILKLMAATS